MANESNDLFTSDPGKAGNRLDYMELYNWGGFHNVHRFDPKRENTLIIGQNGGGKSTFTDAILTLMVPLKRDRFYNQSSGTEMKDSRTEKDYVLGKYGNIYEESDNALRPRFLRDNSNYSVLVACFKNNQDVVTTLFQIRWFANGELKRLYGFSRVPLTIVKDFSKFSGNTKEFRLSLEQRYNDNNLLKQIEFFESVNDYKDRVVRAFRMVSGNALKLFSDIAGLKELGSIDVFFRRTMLEGGNAEEKYIELKKGVSDYSHTMQKIEMAKEKINQLRKINSNANELQNKKKLYNDIQILEKEGEYWFKNKSVEVEEKRKSTLEKEKESLGGEINCLEKDKENLEREIGEINRAIGSNSISNLISNLKKDINGLKEKRENKKALFDKYKNFVTCLNYCVPQDEKDFKENLGSAKKDKLDLEEKTSSLQKKIQELENENTNLELLHKNYKDILFSLKKNNNNIPLKEATIREDIASAIGVKTKELPFVGEIIKVKEGQEKYTGVIEKVLREFALSILVPSKYYKDVCKFVSENKIDCKLVFYKYRETATLLDMRDDDSECITTKLEYNEESPYKDWVKEKIFEKYNFTFVNEIYALFGEKERAVTMMGLINDGEACKKDDRIDIDDKSEYVLGWCAKKKIEFYQIKINETEKKLEANKSDITSLKENLTGCGEKLRWINEICGFGSFEEVNFAADVKEIENKEKKIKDLNENNKVCAALDKQLENKTKEKGELEKTLSAKQKEAGEIENQLNEVEKNIYNYKSQMTLLTAPRDMVSLNVYFNKVNLSDIYAEYENFKKKNLDEINKLNGLIGSLENQIKRDARAFKNPSEQILAKFNDWKSDTEQLPELDENVGLVASYQEMLGKLETENLPEFQEGAENMMMGNIFQCTADLNNNLERWKKKIINTIKLLNDVLKDIEYNTKEKTYVQIMNTEREDDEIKKFKGLLKKALENVHERYSEGESKMTHFKQNVKPLLDYLSDETIRNKVLDVRKWFAYRIEEFIFGTSTKFKSYKGMGELSGGEKLQMTYTIVVAAILYQFGIKKDGSQTDSLRFILVDEAFKGLDKGKMFYFMGLCKRLHLQVAVVDPETRAGQLEDYISSVFVIEKEKNHSFINRLSIEIKEEDE